jgi:AcrR family transcriptional regulator
MRPMTPSVDVDVLAEDLPPKQVHLIRTTYEAISEKGAHRVPLQEIADRAGVSKGVILYYFDTKDDLIRRTMQWVLSRTSIRMREAVATAHSAEEQVVTMVDVIFFSADANRRFYLTYVDLMDHAARLDEFEKLNATFRSIVNASYAEVIEHGIREGEFRAVDVDEAATTVRAIVDGLFLQWLQEKHWKKQHSRYKSMCKRAVLAYLGTGSPEPAHRD